MLPDMKIAFSLDAYNHKIALRYSETRQKWVPFDLNTAEGLIKQELAIFTGYRS